MKKLIFIVYSILILFASWFCAGMVDEYHVSIFLGLFIGGISIPGVLLLREVNPYEPIFWFSIYYYILVLSSFLLITTNFQGSIFLTESYLRGNLNYTFSISLWTVNFAYFFFVFGYSSVRKTDHRFKIRVESYFPANVVGKVAVACFCLGVLNFAWNLYTIAGGDIFLFVKQSAYYSSHLKTWGMTTLGYNFLHPGIYFMLYLVFIGRWTILKFLPFFLVYAIVAISLGRVTNFSVMLLTFGMLVAYWKNIQSFSIRGYVTLSGSAFAFLSLFFFRRFFEYKRVYDISFGEFIQDHLAVSLQILFGKGNLPNIGIIMKIIDSWNLDVGFLYGKSLLTGFAMFLPSSLRTEVIYNSTVSWLSKQIWYADTPGGSLPPTVIGDLYANFGLAGVLFGMFILGLSFAKLYRYICGKEGFFLLFFYVYFLLRFVFILPKGEFSRLSFAFIPLVVIFLALIIKMMTRLVLNSNKLKEHNGVVGNGKL